MKLRAGRTQLASAFTNLTVEANILHIFRVSMVMLALLCSLIALVGPAISIRFYNVKMNSSHLDLSQGIYESLRNSVAEQSSKNADDIGSHFPVDESLTNSEITILSQYAQEQVESAPQYFMGSLWQFCVGYYNVTENFRPSGNVHYIRHDDKLVCNPSSDQRHFFDYIGTLEQYNMEGVLAYSLESSDYTDSHYTQMVARNKKMYKSVPIALIIHCISTICIMLFQYILYSNRNGARDLKKVPKFLLHMLTLASIASFILIAVGAGVSTSMTLKLKRKIKATFGSFGIDLLIGTPWFAMVWLSFCASALFMFSCIIPVWCEDPDEDNDFNDTYVYSRPSDYGKRVAPRQSQMFGAKSVQKPDSSDNPRNQLLYSNNELEDYEGSEEDDDMNKGAYGYHEDAESSLYYDESTSTLPQSSSPTEDVFYNPKEEQEMHKLRRLGESLSRNVSVRQLNKRIQRKKPMRAVTEDDIGGMSEEAVMNFIDDHKAHSPLPHHYRVETFDGFNEVSNNVHRSSTKNSLGSLNRNNTKGSTNSLNRNNTKGSLNSVSRNNTKGSVKSHSNNPFLNINDNIQTLNETTNDQTKRESMLNDDEVNYLESNPFMNRL